MGDLRPYTGSFKTEERDGKAFGSYLRTKTGNIGERALQKYIYPKDGLIAAIGRSYGIQVGAIASEFNLFNEFWADLAIQSVDKRRILLIEMEPGHTTAIFKRKPKRQWASAFEHGYSQVVDWLYRLDDYRKTNQIAAKFNTKESVSLEGLIIIGRSAALDMEDRNRLDWRKGKSVIDSQHFMCATYDEVADQIAEWCSIRKANIK
jgi:hypothetical protein